MELFDLIRTAGAVALLSVLTAALPSLKRALRRML